jgi:hypothetical protein
MVHALTAKGAAIRVGLAIVLVLATYNPSGYSLYHWIAVEPFRVSPGQILALVILLIGWIACLRTALVSLGWFGMGLGVAVFGALVWLLIDYGLISLDGTGVVWLSLVIVGVILGVGLSWSLVRARVTGQIEVQ